MDIETSSQILNEQKSTNKEEMETKQLSQNLIKEETKCSEEIASEEVRKQKLRLNAVKLMEKFFGINHSWKKGRIKHGNNSNS